VLQVPAGLLPLTARKDPRKLDACFALRQMVNQQHMWFRLLGVTGAAVAVADRAEHNRAAAAAKAAGAARLARRYLHNHVQRLQDAHAVELQEQRQQLQQESQQQLQEQAQQHAEQQGLLQQHLEVVQKLGEEQQGQIRDLLAREKELVTDARAKADVMAEQRANVNSLEKQLVEVKSEKASLSHELREAREQLATERGKLEVMLHEGKQVGAVLLLCFSSAASGVLRGIRCILSAASWR
jgi:DNA repair exonuclease SbcCD ATPase subunit